jgi:hypothetical protein
MDKLDKLLQAANNRLKKSNCGITIFKRGQKLSLRGILPPKAGKEKSSQQTIALDIYANAAGIQVAEKKAQKLASQLALSEFNWNNWKSESANPTGTAGEWIDHFEADYFQRRAKTSQSLTTWEGDYSAILKRLPKNEVLSDRLLTELIFTTEPDSRQRKRTVMVAEALATFAGLTVDFSKYRGNYSHLKGDRILPTDKEIIKQYWSIPNPAWQYVYGLMAAYGISNHEVFLVDLESLRSLPGHLTSNYRKNHYGTRRIWCLYPEWWQEWELYKPKSLPQITGKDNKTRGARITSAMHRYGVCKPGDLRHCWAIRAMGFMPNALAARMMAHTEKVHNETYQRWINQEQEDSFYQILMSRSDRPIPPN